MNNGKFSLMKFSLKTMAEPDFQFSVSFSDNVRGMVSFSQNILVEQFYNVSIDGRALCTAGIYFAANYQSDVQSKVVLYPNVKFTASYADDVMSKVYLASDMNAFTLFDDVVEAKVFVSKDSTFGVTFEDNINSLISIVKNMLMDRLNLSAQVYCIISADIVDTKIFNLSVTLNPGEEIRIDSEMFTVTKNGENIIHLFDGDWIYLSREVFALVATAAGAPLTGKVIYVERYL